MRWLILVTLLACGGPKPDPGTPTNRTTEAPQPHAGDVEAKSPHQIAPWIKKLADPRERERALSELQQLGDPAAIEPIGKIWAQDREVRALQVVISLARPLTPADAKAQFVTDYETSGRPSSWTRAAPFLLQAVREIDGTNPRSVDTAVKAADALGEARLPDSVEPLFSLAGRAPNKRTFPAQIAAIRALGRLVDFRAKIGLGLARLIDVDPVQHPRTAKTKADARALEETFGMYLAITGAAINALGALRVTTESKVLILALYRTPELASQIRRALVASGPTARDALLEVLAGKHAAVEQLFKAKKLGRYCGDKGDVPDNQCQPIALRDFYAALALGDFHHPRTVPALLDALKRPDLPAYYSDDQAGPTQHAALFDALRKIGSAESAAPLRAMWKDRNLGLMSRTGALEAYGFVARDATAAKELGLIALDNGADDDLRLAAANTLARLSVDKLDLAAFLGLAKKYLDASAKKRKEADARKPATDAADKPLAIAKQKLDSAKDAVVAATKDPDASADQIRTATRNARQAEDEYKVAKKKHKEATAPFRQLDQASKAYLGFARVFQTHVARVDVAIRCKDSLDCYVGSLKLTRDDAARHVSVYVKDATTWTTDEKAGLVEAAIERSMLELGKRGVAASPHTEVLLDAAVSDNRIVRQSILLALPKIAMVPCASCVAKLDAAIAAGEGKTALGSLNFETVLLRNYFAWAGGRVP